MSADDPRGLPHEGDLDPDLTEGAGYSGWERRRRWRPIALRVVSVLLVAGLVVPIVLRALTD
jgi:hypothetical protein